MLWIEGGAVLVATLMEAADCARSTWGAASAPDAPAIRVRKRRRCMTEPLRHGREKVERQLCHGPKGGEQRWRQKCQRRIDAILRLNAAPWRHPALEAVDHV